MARSNKPGTPFTRKTLENVPLSQLHILYNTMSTGRIMLNEEFKENVSAAFYIQHQSPQLHREGMLRAVDDLKKEDLIRTLSVCLDIPEV